MRMVQPPGVLKAQATRSSFGSPANDLQLGYTTPASWVLITAFTVSALDELFRSTAKAGTSNYDATRGS